MVQDPNFWRRFSVAVHNDEAAMLAKDLESGKKETKHAYVMSHSSPLDSPTTPNSQTLLSPAFPPAAFARPLSAPVPILQREAASAREQRRSHAAGEKSVYFSASVEEKAPEMIALHKLPSPSSPQTSRFSISPPPSPKPNRISRLRFPLTSHPPTQPSTPLSATFAPSTKTSPSTRWSRIKNPNGSRLSLGVSLSGRPKSAFRFWTTISADAATSRDSEWLEGQRRKARQRTWMCWLFWMVFLVVVVGAVVTVVVLRGKGII
ncbi:hypothetical protein G6514_009029 [Epicoccum nigrum]|nr:hypothetical protein G6514_009029 [Epicoccum nigrum]